MPEHAAAVAAESKYAFGPFVLDPVSRRLWRDGEAVAITARVFDILVVLVRRHGQPVDKDVLIEQVWGDPLRSHRRYRELAVAPSTE
jgi:DNA-binding winged helix-turn-helix (wHTH) protein